MTSTAKKKCGRVCLIGAGPGDAGLITVRGLERLRAADVVVFDALVNPDLLTHAPPGARFIDVGKRARKHTMTQDQINRVLVREAIRGRGRERLVVRLKGGDPYLFGRGAEEASFLARHGVECEVVPGVTSGIAAPAAAGIPVTHRRLASSVTFVTGHEDPTKPETAINYRSLAGLIKGGESGGTGDGEDGGRDARPTSKSGGGGTVCFYMGASRLGSIAASLMKQGLAGKTPVAVVQWGTTPRQRSVRTTLARAAAAAAKAGLGAPAIIVVGAVAAIAEPGLDYFTRRPLFGQTILITRTRQQASELREQLAELGARVLEAPTIDLVPPGKHDLAAVDRALRRIGDYDWLVFTSINGVAAVAERMEKLGLDARSWASVKIAAIGEPTAQELRRLLGVAADLVPTRFVAESLAAELIAKESMKGVRGIRGRFLLLRADIARPTLPRLLTATGAKVTELTVYQTRLSKGLPADVVAALRAGQVDWVTFTSASTARNLAELLGQDRGVLKGLKIASIGPITTEAVRELGLTPGVEAKVSTIEGLVAALVQAGGGRRTATSR